MHGVDFLKDDENLTDQNFNKFESRLKACAKARDKAEKITGEKKDYFINVTAETNEMIRRARLVKKYGFRYVMVDIMTVGWAAVQTLRNETQKLKMAIHAHRAFHAAFDRNPKHGMSMLVIAKLARLIGVDTLHIGTVIGKLVGTKDEVLQIEDEITNPWYGLKDTIPVSSGGLHPGLIPEITKMLGKDICIQLGGGIHGHPKGTHAGSKATRQAIDATLKNIPLKKYSEKNEELKQALSKWHFSKPI